MNLSRQWACHVTSRHAVTRASGSAVASMNVTNRRVRMAQRCGASVHSSIVASTRLAPARQVCQNGWQAYVRSLYGKRGRCGSPLPWHVRHARKARFEVRDSKFRKPRTSDLEPSPISPIPPVSHCYPARVAVLVPDVQAIEVLLCRNGFSTAC